MTSAPLLSPPQQFRDGPRQQFPTSSIGGKRTFGTRDDIAGSSITVRRRLNTNCLGADLTIGVPPCLARSRTATERLSICVAVHTAAINTAMALTKPIAKRAPTNPATIKPLNAMNAQAAAKIQAPTESSVPGSGGGASANAETPLISQMMSQIRKADQGPRITPKIRNGLMSVG